MCDGQCRKKRPDEKENETEYVKGDVTEGEEEGRETLALSFIFLASLSSS